MGLDLLVLESLGNERWGVGTFSYEDYAGPEGCVPGREAHEYAVWTGVLETRAAEWS